MAHLEPNQEYLTQHIPYQLVSQFSSVESNQPSCEILPPHRWAVLASYISQCPIKLSCYQKFHIRIHIGEEGCDDELTPLVSVPSLDINYPAYLSKMELNLRSILPRL